MLLTAIAATVVIVSWVGDAVRDPGAPDPPRARGTQLTEQPLTGLGAGVTVREVSQDTPFSLVALTGDLAGTSTRVRAKRPDGGVGPWYQTEYETEAPDAALPPPGERFTGLANPGGAVEGPRSTDPVFVGSTTTVQIAVTRPIDAPLTQPPSDAPANAQPGHDGLGYKPASKEQPFGENISAILISTPQATAKTHWTATSGVIMPGQ